MPKFPKNKTIIFLGTILAVLILPKISWAAEDLYVAQTVVGGNTGADCANAHSMAWLNTAGNWGSGPNKVSAGDTVHFCGTITSPLVIQDSGSAGNVITLLFEPGAKFSKAYWGIDGSAAIYGSSKSYITIDGDGVGIIENTDNGTSLTYQQYSQGIKLNLCNNIEIKNLTIQNIYVRTGTTDTLTGTVGVYLSGGNNLSIHDCTFSHMLVGPYGDYVSISSTWNIYNNTISNVNWGIGIGSGTTDVTLDVLNIYNNTITNGTNWGTPTCTHHNNGIIVWASHTGAQITNEKIYNNTIGPTFSTGTDQCCATSHIFLEGKHINPVIYNNVLTLPNSSYAPADGAIYLKDDGYGMIGAKAYNNTIYFGNVKGTGIYYTSPQQDILINNNILFNVGVPIYNDGQFPTSGSQIDYNNYYGGSNWGKQYYNFAGWKSASGCDAHTTTNQPLFVSTSDYHLQDGDTAAKDKGVDLGSPYNIDKGGVTRPQGSAWDIGAYEYAEAPDTTPPNPPTGVTVQ